VWLIDASDLPRSVPRVSARRWLVRPNFLSTSGDAWIQHHETQLHGIGT
jgi:hypothetical protein